MSDELIGEVKARRATEPSMSDRIEALRGVEGIRDPVPLEQMCPRCRGRGFVQFRGTSTACNCAVGRQIVYRDIVLKTLTEIETKLHPGIDGKRAALQWLEDVHPKFRDRPLHLLRDERASQVFEEIRRAAETAGVSPPQLPVFMGAQPTAPTAVENLRDTAYQRTLAELRRVGRTEAAQLVEEDRVDEMKDNDRAFLDALMYGTGYLIDGKYVQAKSVQVFRWGRHPSSPDPGPR